MQMCSAKGVKRLNMKRNTQFPQIQPSAIDESIGNDALLQKHAFNIPPLPIPHIGITKQARHTSF